MTGRRASPLVESAPRDRRASCIEGQRAPARAWHPGTGRLRDVAGASLAAARSTAPAPPRASTARRIEASLRWHRLPWEIGRRSGAPGTSSCMIGYRWSRTAPTLQRLRRARGPAGRRLQRPRGATRPRTGSGRGSSPRRCAVARPRRARETDPVPRVRHGQASSTESLTPRSVERVAEVQRIGASVPRGRSSLHPESLPAARTEQRRACLEPRSISPLSAAATARRAVSRSWLVPAAARGCSAGPDRSVHLWRPRARATAGTVLVVVPEWRARSALPARESEAAETASSNGAGPLMRSAG